MTKSYSNFTPSEAILELTLITNTVKTAPNPFDLTTGFLSAATSSSDDLADAVNAQRAAETAYRNATIAKNEALRAATSLLSQGAKTALASGASTNQLASIGMKRPAKPTRPTSLNAPTSLVATALSDSQTKIAFDRNGNAQGAVFEIFASTTGTDFQMVASTTRASVTLSGYAPGAACWFKVRATRAGLASPFSDNASTYAPAAPSTVQLRVA